MLRATATAQSIHRHGILPVTALTVLETPSGSILAIGQGTQLYLRPLDPVLSTNAASGVQTDHPKLLYAVQHAEVLIGQAIHGIVSVGPSISEDRIELNLLVYGGSQVALVVVIYCADHSSIKIVDRLYIPNEWVITTNPVPTSADTVVCLTSYNTISHIDCHGSKHQLRQDTLCNEVSTFLYSGTIRVVSKDQYIIASGTALGEVLVWTCRYESTSSSWETSPFRKFEGHRGSIFGVSISPPLILNGQTCQMVASCSDDRTIRLWDVSNLKDKRPEDGGEDMSRFLVSTECSGMVWGHLSRIWTVDFLQDTSADAADPNGWLISTGEDGTVQSWSVEATNGSWKITNVCQDRHHAGKNVWSHCIHNLRGRLDVYSGGADGRVVRRPYCTASRSVIAGPTLTQELFPRLQSPTLEEARCMGVGSLKYYRLVNLDALVCSTDKGALLLGRKTIDGIEWSLMKDISCQSSLFATDPASGNVLAVDEKSRHLTRLDLTTGLIDQLGVFGQEKVGYICASSFLRDGERILCVVVSCYSTKQIELWMMGQSNEYRHRVKVDLPEAFIASAVLYDEDNDALLCGSRAGALVVCTNVTTDPKPMSCVRHAHGSDAVTQIVKIDTQETQHCFYLTTGRDGFYCVHRVDLRSGKISTVHRSMPPLGPYIEGVHVLVSPDEKPRIILHGFRSTEFVVWDETEQRQLFAVLCGGAHRSWTFHLDQSGSSATFVWTQAGKSNYKHWSWTDHEVVQRGSHGREIKALAVHRLGQDGSLLLATGSEDTNVHLMVQTMDETELRTLVVLRRHMTGLQDLKFSADGRILFSAAGMEELFAWNITSVPVLGYGVTFASSLPRTDAQSDARIMAIDVRSNEDNSYELIAALSSGHFKLLQYKTELSTFEVLKTIDVGGSTCLTQVTFLNHQPNLFVGAATDGHARLYDLSAGCFQGRQKVHQNSVTALEAVHHDSEALVLVTGGDDNALAITLNNTKGSSSSLKIPDAHAAALTALATIQIDAQTYYILTAGNDQRVKVWSLRITAVPHPMQTDNVQLDLLADEYTNVADISGLEVLQHSRQSAATDVTSNPDVDGDGIPSTTISSVSVSALVVGVGMEMLDLSIQSTISM